MSWLQIENKSVLITGGASGIGRVLANAFVRQNASVAIADQNIKAGKNTLDELMLNSDKEHYFFPTDISNPKSVSQMFDAYLKKAKKIDILINNAGINIPNRLVDITVTEIDKTYAVNQRGLIICTQEAASYMKKQGYGVVINVSSESGLEGSIGQSIYSATKAAVYSLTRSWAKELGPLGIRVVGIAPGPLEETGMTNNTYMSALATARGQNINQIKNSYSSAIPLQRPGHLTEVADVILFLASPKASYITGTVINVSGGKSRS